MSFRIPGGGKCDGMRNPPLTTTDNSKLQYLVAMGFLASLRNDNVIKDDE
ncbi:MAG: hypothetical protein K8R74_00340 [Bacteroidales bacterium]|nr:hypothetical protein [Bacteroidales bacterium]